MNTYQVDLWRQAVALCVYAVILVALLALLLGVGWSVWDYLMNHSMPYNDPEAIGALRRTILL